LRSFIVVFKLTR